MIKVRDLIEKLSEFIDDNPEIELLIYDSKLDKIRFAKVEKVIEHGRNLKIKTIRIFGTEII